uniref:Uncharacterized protein n=1 Tax=Oryza nivara TaxID=4536 RepID=A0A0E0GBB1_ORYNI
MAIHLSLRVAPPDLQQGGNSRISYFLVPINKTSPFSSLFRNRYRNWCFFYFVYVSDWGISGKAYVGYLSGVGCSFNFCIHLVSYLPGCTAFSKASCRTGSYFNPCPLYSP